MKAEQPEAEQPGAAQPEAAQPSAAQPDADHLSARLTAIASTQRMRIVAAVAAETTHVSELARRLGMSRALLYMHLQRLEEAGFIAGRFELSDDGKALKLFEVVPFDIPINLGTIVASVAATPPREREN